MWTIGHNSKSAAGAGALAIAVALAAGAVAPTAAVAQEQSSDSPAPVAKLEFNGLSSKGNIVVPELPDIVVPKQVVDGAGKVGISLPERIALSKLGSRAGGTAEAVDVAVEKQLFDASEKQLVKQGHRRDAEAQAIATAWANQAVRGEATFTGDTGKGTTDLNRGTGNIYKMDEKAAAERLAYLSQDEQVDAVETTPVKDPKRFGVATARKDGDIYLVEYFLD